MYFRNRAEAGRQLAKKLQKYANENIAVISLSQGGVIVGAQVAMELHGNLSLLLTENISLPGEPDAVASITSGNTFTYNNKFSPGELEEFSADYHQYIEAKRIEGFHHLNMILGKDGEIPLERLRHHTVVLVSDGLASGFSLQVAYDYLKTVALKRLIIATPFATVKAVDVMHLLGDELVCLSVIENFFTVDHYYEDNTIPPTEDLFRVVNNISLNWSRDS